MGLINVLKLANKVEGTYVEVGFGKGRTARKAFNAMNEGTITKRESWLIDSFQGTDIPSPQDFIYNPEIDQGYDPGRYQVAMDMRYDLTNPSQRVFVLKSFASDILISKYNGGTIACLHIDLPTYSGVVSTLEALHPMLNLYAVVYVGGYNYSLGIRKAVDSYIEDNNLNYQLLSTGTSSYLLNKVAPVSFIKPSIQKNTFVPEDTIPVSRPKIVPFADRYIKPVIERFRSKINILNKEVEEIKPLASRDSEFKPEEGIAVSRPKVVPFNDRYDKPETTTFIQKKIIKDGLSNLGSNVSRTTTDQG